MRGAYSIVYGTVNVNGMVDLSVLHCIAVDAGTILHTHTPRDVRVEQSTAYKTKHQGEAEATALRAKGEAEAANILAKGEAEAKVCTTTYPLGSYQ